jgi:hypothetical protein
MRCDIYYHTASYASYKKFDTFNRVCQSDSLARVLNRNNGTKQYNFVTRCIVPTPKSRELPHLMLVSSIKQSFSLATMQTQPLSIF